MTTKLKADAVASLLRPGMDVFVHGGPTEPASIIAALQSNGDASAGVNYVSTLIPGINATDFASFHPDARMQTFFMIPQIQESYAAGKVDLFPFQLSAIHTYLTTQAKFDMVFVQVSPPDDNGQCSFGIAADYVPDVLDRTKIIVAEINSSLPTPPGSAKVAYDRLDYVVETDHQLVLFDTPEPKGELAALGRNVANLINDGDTIQLGIGSAPAAILAELGDKRDLGVHSGMIPESVIQLMEKGVITGTKKTIDRGSIVTGTAIGTQALYDFLGTDTRITYKPVNYTHNITVLGEIDNLIAINSVIEVDLLGQSNCEYVGGRQISGIGGQLDFVRGAHRSKGGKSIQALQATARKGTLSRIVPKISTDAVVSVPRTDVGYVVTEFGVADLRYTPVMKRAEKIIAIAAPEFRDQLSNDWDEICRQMTD